MRRWRTERTDAGEFWESDIGVLLIERSSEGYRVVVELADGNGTRKKIPAKSLTEARDIVKKIKRDLG